jgi:phosphopantothenate-cysteine ligase
VGNLAILKISLTYIAAYDILADMNILITSGGTSERIDPVRRIANSATGRLGALIAERFGADGANVYYVCGANACVPNVGTSVGAALAAADGGVTVRRIDDTADLESAVRELCAAVKFDAVIHAAAVSDYRVVSVSSGGAELDRSQKISSTLPELTIALEPTPKIISLYRELAPNACLVGFKLLDSVSREELFSAARKVMDANNCAFVLANDGSQISGDAHVGHLLKRDGSAAEFTTKQDIAEGIFDAVTTWSERKHSGV